MGRTPGGMHVVIGRAHVGGVGIGQPPLLRRHVDGVAGHHIEAARLQGTHTLGEDERLAREVLRHVLHPLVMIVEANHVDGTTLEEVIVRTRLVAACHDGARGIMFLDDLSQMLRQERLHTEFTILGQCRGIVACVQDEVRLLQRQRVGLRRRPLFQHLVAYRPHQDGGVVAVAEYEV